MNECAGVRQHMAELLPLMQQYLIFTKLWYVHRHFLFFFFYPFVHIRYRLVCGADQKVGLCSFVLTPEGYKVKLPHVEIMKLFHRQTRTNLHPVNLQALNQSELMHKYCICVPE